MHNFWKGVARFLAVVSAIVFVLAALGSLFLVAADRRLLSPATYKNALNQQQIYARMPRVIAEQIILSLNYNPCTENPLSCEAASPEFLDCARNRLGPDRTNALTGGQGLPTPDELTLIQPCLEKFPLKSGAGGNGGGQSAFIKNLSVTNWETIIGTLFPPDALRRTTENLIDQFFAYLNGRQKTVTLNLVDLKNRLAGQAGVNSLLELVRAQPACSDQQLLQFLASLVSGGGEVSLCQPPQEVLDQLKPVIQDQLAAFASLIPDQRVLLSPETGENTAASGPSGTSSLVAAVRLAHLGMRLSPDLALGFLLLITLFAVRTPKSWLRWWGIPFFLTGVLSILFALLLSPLFERGWVALLAGKVPASLSLGTISLGHDLARAVIQSLGVGVGFGGIFLGLLGAGMWIGSTFIKTGSESQERAAPPAAAA